MRGDYGNLPIEIQQVGISVIFDMEWQKRATGQLYDSLSGHGFVIGCRTTNVVGYGVTKKYVQKVAR